MIRLFISDPDPDFVTNPDPGVKKTPDPGSGSATLVRVRALKKKNVLNQECRAPCLVAVQHDGLEAPSHRLGHRALEVWAVHHLKPDPTIFNIY